MSLIQKIARGDMDALAKLYEKHKTSVYRVALSLTADPYLAEDITQETFLKIQEQAVSYRKNQNESAWILTIARNLSYDCLRKRKREVSNPDEELLQLQKTFHFDETSSYFFLQIIESLSQEEKEVICLRILADLPWKEIGQILNHPADTCRKRYERALHKLSILYRKDCL